MSLNSILEFPLLTYLVIFCYIDKIPGDGDVQLEKAVILAYNQLQSNLAPHGYESKPIQFCLCVDNFGIKYEQKADAEHLIQTL